MTLPKWVSGALIIALSLFVAYAYAGTDVAVTYNEVGGSRGWGATLDYDTALGEESAFEFHTVGQKTGTEIRGKYNLEVSRAFGSVDGVLFGKGNYRGNSISDLGRTLDIGIGVELPPVGNTTITVGVFGRNAGPFGPRNARADLESLGYGPDQLDGMGLEDLSPAPSGLSIKAGNSVNLLVSADLGSIKGVSLVLDVMPELGGEGDNRVHQAILSASTDFAAGNGFSVEVGADVGVQTFDGEYEKEFSTLVAVKKSF